MFARSLKKRIAKIPVLGSLAAILIRYHRALSYCPPQQRRILKWLFSSREMTNFTYDLEPQNRSYLAAFSSEITGCVYGEIESYFDELEQDQRLKDHIRTRTNEDRLHRRLADPDLQPARRLGWYAVVRALKPRVVVETGVDKGLGSLILIAALRRNAQEGQPGHYYGTDINPEAGFLLSEPYSEYGEILIGDSIASLSKLDCRIDLLVNDSDHSPAYEAREYETVRGKLTDRAIILGDNAHISDALFRFALKTHRRFLFFNEQPRNHWFPGGGIGAAFGSR